jgi:DNA repair protein RadC
MKKEIFRTTLLHLISSKKIASLMQRVLRRELKSSPGQQLAWGLSFDKDGSILNIEQISRKGLDEHSFLPVDILSVALQKQSAGFMLVHNHAAGQLTPTASDQAITARLIKCGELLKMPLLDHLIIDGKNQFSFQEKGLMTMLDIEAMFDPADSFKELFGQELEEAIEENDRLKDHIVTMMYEANYSIQAIMDKTGLSRGVVLNILFGDEEEIDPDSHFESASPRG